MDTLLDVPESPLSDLQRARIRFDEARAAYESKGDDKAGSDEMYAFFNAQSRLIDAEADELRRLKA